MLVRMSAFALVTLLVTAAFPLDDQSHGSADLKPPKSPARKTMIKSNRPTPAPPLVVHGEVVIPKRSQHPVRYVPATARKDEMPWSVWLNRQSVWLKRQARTIWMEMKKAMNR